jgi:hypothetical protein
MENIKRTDKDNPIKKIIIEYEDGTKRDVEKGFIADVGAICNADEDEEADVHFNFVNIGGKDIAEVIYAVTELGVRMGLFDN